MLRFERRSDSGIAENIFPVIKDQLVAIVCELFGGSITEPIVLGDAPNEIPHQYLSAEKARTDLGWAPRYTLTEGLVETIAWYQANQTWVNQVRLGEYLTYYEKQYGARLAS